MFDIQLATLGVAEMIDPAQTSVAMPLSAFWAGLVALFIVAIAVVKTAFTVGQLKAIVDTKLITLHEDHQRFELRINRHSDLFDTNQKEHHELDKRLSGLEPRSA